MTQSRLVTIWTSEVAFPRPSSKIVKNGPRRLIFRFQQHSVLSTTSIPSFYFNISSWIEFYEVLWHLRCKSYFCITFSKPKTSKCILLYCSSMELSETLRKGVLALWVHYSSVITSKQSLDRLKMTFWGFIYGGPSATSSGPKQTQIHVSQKFHKLHQIA